MNRGWSVLAGLLLGLSVVSVGRAADDPRIDETTGAEVANYPPPRHFDHLHLRLEMDIPDMKTPAFTARQVLTLRPIGRARERVVLNAGKGLKITSVRVAPASGPMAEGVGRGRAAVFAHVDERLEVTLPEPARLGQILALVIEYAVENVGATGFGLTWTMGKPDGTGLTEISPQIHSQGQPEFNRQWLVLHDFPNERMTTELVVTVEDGFVTLSNGKLLGTSLAAPGPGGRPRTTWRWLQAQPHPGYLISLVVGKFAIVGLPADPPIRNTRGEVVPLSLYTPFGTEDRAAEVYAKTGPMLQFLAEWLDEPYPWDKYAQSIVRNFAAGGMENTSASTMNERTATARPGSQDGLIMHEAAHQWLGDMITCKSWEHAWLNEGWASYCEALWTEHDASAEGGASAGQRAYQRRIASFLGAQRGLNRTYAPLFPALASRRYNQPLDVFMKPNDIYAKGAVVLHMLRMQLGDEVFQRAVRVYVDRFRFREVETDDFRHVLEEVSGRSLERFFAQWVDRPGFPRLAAELEWTPAPSPGPAEGSGTLTIKISQTQKIDEANPAYWFELPIEVTLPGDQRRVITMLVNEREQTASFALPAKPADVVFDPKLSIAAPTAVRKPLAMWIEQSRHASVLAQLQAAEYLAMVDDPAATRALLDMASDPAGVDVVLAMASEALVRRIVSDPEHWRPAIRMATSGWSRFVSFLEPLALADAR